MTKIKQILCALLLLPMISTGQIIDKASTPVSMPNEKGIQWTTGLTWEQVKVRAKEEKKYIFLDVTATWCGPCKLMDKEVFPNDSIGNLFNKNFISVKVQVDKTSNDNEHVQSWYSDAVIIQKQYRVLAYPTFIFLSPEGQVVDKQSGYLGVKHLYTIAQSAIIPGKLYEDPLAAYDLLVNEYKKGKRYLDRLPYMISTAFRLDDREFGFQLLKDYNDYCAKLSPEQRYTKENIEMWDKFLFSSKSEVFRFFYEDGKIIDRVMGMRSFAEKWVCRIIEDEIVWPFLKQQGEKIGNPNMVPGMVLSGSRVKTFFDEANWADLSRMIRKRYNRTYAKRCVINAKVQWYMRNNNQPALAEIKIEKQNIFPPDISKEEDCLDINEVGWNVFLYSMDKKVINRALYWQKKAIDQYPLDRFRGTAGWVDTYANLLYKLGRVEEAISWELKAMEGEESISLRKIFQKTLEKMKKGEPTYVEEYGAVWQ